jgi:hypothetical protein
MVWTCQPSDPKRIVPDSLFLPKPFNPDEVVRACRRFAVNPGVGLGVRRWVLSATPKLGDLRPNLRCGTGSRRCRRPSCLPRGRPRTMARARLSIATAVQSDHNELTIRDRGARGTPIVAPTSAAFSQRKSGAARLLARSIRRDLHSLATNLVKRGANSSPTAKLSAGKIGRVCKPVAKCIASAAVVGALLIAVTMLWGFEIRR